MNPEADYSGEEGRGHGKKKGRCHVQLVASPLHLLNNVQAAVEDELVQMSRLVCES